VLASVSSYLGSVLIDDCQARHFVYQNTSSMIQFRNAYRVMLKQVMVVNSQVHNASLIKLSMPMYEFRSENLTITANQFFDGQIVSS
jgi:hypothetical protein